MNMNATDIANIVSDEIIVNRYVVKSPEIIVLTGLPYSGKSYLAEKLETYNYAHFWATKIKKQFSVSNPEMLDIAQQVLNIVVAERHNLVIDFMNYRYEMRQRFQQAAKVLNAQYRVVFLDTSKEERLRRREQNVAQGDMLGHSIMSLERIQELENMFELPGEGETFIRLVKQSDIDTFLSSL